MSQLNGSTVLDSLHINPSIVNSQPRVVISGAGPVGLFTALKLVQAGVHVDVLEKDTKVNESPRAAGYYAGAMAALLKSGIVPSMVELGHVENGLAWMKPPIADGAGGKKHGDKVAFIPFPEATREHPEKGMLILPQSKFTRLLLDIVAKQELAKVHFGQELCAIHEEGEQVIATTNDVMTGEKRTFVASFLVGADGGSSPTRKILGIGLHGHTWPTRLVATDVKKKNHILSEYAARFIIHPTHFAAIIPLEEPIQGQESLWRYAIALDAKDVRSDEEVLSETGIRDLYETVMAGPRPLEYEVQRKAVYRAHQRLAQTMRRGRCLLAGDAAHLNAPFGAMGLSSGILDAEAVADTLKLVLMEKKPLSLLDVYSDERRKVFSFFVNPNTTENILRLMSDPEKAADDDWFLREMRDPKPADVGRFIVPYLTTWTTDMNALATEKGM